MPPPPLPRYNPLLQRLAAPHMSRHAAPLQTGLLEEHKKATGSDKLARGGYPDMGARVPTGGRRRA